MFSCHTLVVSILTLWFAASVLNQFPRSSAWAITAWDHIGFVPFWNFFAPEPVSSDYYLVYRHFGSDGWIGPWQDFTVPPKRALLSWIWHPHRRSRKIIMETAFAIITNAATVEESASIRLGTPYLLILHCVSRAPRFSDSVAVQYAFIRQSHRGSNESPVAFVSDIHLLP